VSNFDNYVGQRTCQIVPITAPPSASIGDENAGCAPASSGMKRRHAATQFQQSAPLDQRLKEQAERLRKEEGTPPGMSGKSSFAKPGRRRQLRMQEWLSSPGLQPPAEKMLTLVAYWPDLS